MFEINSDQTVFAEKFSLGLDEQFFVSIYKPPNFNIMKGNDTLSALLHLRNLVRIF